MLMLIAQTKHTKTTIPQDFKSHLRYLLLFTLCFIASISYAQKSITISGTFKGNSTYAQVVLKQFTLGTSPIAGAKISGDSFLLSLPPQIPQGVYRLQYAFAQNEQYLDIIINGKDKNIAFTLQADEPNAIPQFTHSEENKLWYNYMANNNQQLARISLLNQFINAYPTPQAEIVKVAEQEWEKEKTLYWENFEHFKNTMQGSLAYEMVVNRPYYFTNPKDHPRTQDYYKRVHFWDGFNASNPALINTPLYTEHILNYLRYWMNPDMGYSQEEQTKGFKSAVDTIIQKFSGTVATQEFAYKYLLLGFKEIGQEEILQYLDEQYSTLAEQCLNETEKTEYEKRMEGYATLQAGNIAPEIVFPDTLIYPNPGFQPNKLSEFNSQYTLVVFGSSWCPACTEELPKIASNYPKWQAQGIDVLFVSLDEDLKAFYQFAAQFPFISITDLKKWNSPIAKDFYVFGTPTMYLLDNQRKIIVRATSFNEINAWVDWYLVKGNALPR